MLFFIFKNEMTADMKLTCYIELKIEYKGNYFF